MNEIESKSLLAEHILSFDDSDFVYRILRFEHLIDFLDSNILRFPRITSWDDSYENWLYKSSITLDNENFGQAFFSEPYMSSFFALCWSYWPETDALWKVYSQNKDRVQIKVNVGKLTKAISENLQLKYGEPYAEKLRTFPYPGRVVYVYKHDLNTFFSHETYLDAERLWALHNLFVKRMEFEYENEFRTILYTMDDMKDINLFDLEVDAQDLVEEIVFDPRIRPELENNYTHRLKDLGFEKYRKSSLYDPVDLNLTHDISTLENQQLRVYNYYNKMNSIRLGDDKNYLEFMKQLVRQMNLK